MRGGPNPSGKGTIPDITNSTKSWLKEDIAEYLSSGFTPDFDVAGGYMAEVIEGTKHLTQIDKLAIAAYIKSVPNLKE
jgi:hypothetical protein